MEDIASECKPTSGIDGAGDTKDAESKAAAENDVAHLEHRPDGLYLVRGQLETKADFAKSLPRLKQGRLQSELLVKAAKPKSLTPNANGKLIAIDATAGMGEDSLLLAAAGFEVIMFERDEVIAALLEDGLSRAKEDTRLAEIASRMTLRHEDSITALGGIAHERSAAAPALILLDPMFPARTKSAAVKKKFQLIHDLEQPCDDEERLMRAAIGARPQKVVVKRPVKGPDLAGIKPAYRITGKAIRYDVIIPAQMPDMR
jgi:16S rRNA (guanine1516-N2)-methyltransferase